MRLCLKRGYLRTEVRRYSNSEVSDDTVMHSLPLVQASDMCENTIESSGTIERVAVNMSISFSGI